MRPKPSPSRIGIHINQTSHTTTAKNHQAKTRTRQIMAAAIDNLLSQLGPEIKDHEEG